MHTGLILVTVSIKLYYLRLILKCPVRIEFIDFLLQSEILLPEACCI